MPQLEDGHLRIANELYDAILRHPFSMREVKVLMAIIRKTYGFNKKTDDMSASQIAEMTGLARESVVKALNSLAKKSVVTKSRGVYGQVIGINKNYKNWGSDKTSLVMTNHQQRGQNVTTDDKLSPSGDKTSPKVVTNCHTQKTTPKNTKQNKFTSADKSAAEAMLSGVADAIGKTPRANLDKWADTIRLMRERDGMSLDDVMGLFNWANRDSFWRTVILSPANLRDKQDKLMAQMRRKGGSNATNRRNFDERTKHLDEPGPLRVINGERMD